MISRWCSTANGYKIGNMLGSKRSKRNLCRTCVSKSKPYISKNSISAGTRSKKGPADRENQQQFEIRVGWFSSFCVVPHLPSCVTKRYSRLYGTSMKEPQVLWNIRGFLPVWVHMQTIASDSSGFKRLRTGNDFLPEPRWLNERALEQVSACLNTAHRWAQIKKSWGKTYA